MPKKANSKPYAKKLFNLFISYFFNSDEKLTAWLLLFGSALCVVSLITIMTVFSWWTAEFWAILTAKVLTPFLISIGEFVLLAGAFVGANVLQNHLIGKLSISWRSWLTNKIIKELFTSENNFLDLKRHPAIVDNTAQRIQEDIKNFVELSLSLGTNFLKSVLSIGAFSGTLWVVGGPLTFEILDTSIIIPGYLVWVALTISVIATIITHAIGKLLPKITKNAENAEADLRQYLAQLNNEAENIAEEHAENYYKAALVKKVQCVKDTANQKLNIQTRIIAFQSFYFQMADILPRVLAAPLYFSGLIEVGQLMQIGVSFNEIRTSMSLFVDAYEKISTCRASIHRIAQLQNAFEEEGISSAHTKAIIRKERDKDSINIKNLNIRHPQVSSTSCIMRNISIKLNPGEHVLIKGPSGLGKSTLFKAISGTWKYGEGKIAIPRNADKRLYFLPQRPALPNDTLRAALAYPDPEHTYTEDQYNTALQTVGGMDHLISKLDKTCHWSQELSPGQQQRISFARALLKKPDWLFLDEATSSLDEEGEDHVYKAVKQKLSTTTFVSIGHRSTTEKYHSKIVFFSKKNEEKEIKLTLRPAVSAKIKK